MTREFHVPTESPIGRALTQRESGDLEGAIETLMAAIGDTLADAQVAVTLAKMLDESGRGEMAVRWFRHAMKIAPDDAIVRMSYGTFLASQGHFDEAHELLEGARRDAHALLAVMATGLVDPDPALEGFLGVTETNLARAAFERGDSARARSRRALVGARGALGERARRALRRARARRPRPEGAGRGRPRDG